MVTFIDDYSRYTVLYFLKKKSEVFGKFKEYVATAERQTGNKLKKLRDDKGSEYISKEMKGWMKERGIMYQETHKAAPYENAVAERYNRTIFDKVRTNLIHANMASELWAECAATVNYCKNRLPHATIEEIPFRRWTGSKPMLTNFKEWGQKVIFHVQDRTKLQPRGKRGRLVGYNVKNTKGYRVYDPATKKIVLTKDVIFLADRTKTTSEYINPNLTPEQESNIEYAIIADTDKFDNADGTVERRKARLVAKGFSQRQNIDYFETFAPVARLESIRFALAIAISREYEIHQADVKNAYLNGVIDTELYMEMPDGFKIEGKIRRLKKGLYGLKQAGRLWYDNFNEFMNARQYKNLRSDPCIYIGADIIIILYVDDIIICAPLSKIEEYIKTV